MKAWIVFVVAFAMLSTVAYADNSISLYLSASSGYQGMPVTANFYYSGFNFNHFVAGWSTSSGVCTISCQTFYGSSQSSYTTVPYNTGTLYYTVIAYDVNNNVVSMTSVPFNVNYQYQPYQPYYQPYQPYYQTYYQSCVPQYQATYQCLGNQLQQIYQNSNCATQWTTVQTCNAGCFSPNQNVGYCIGGGYTPYGGYAGQTCTPNTQVCNGNYVQKCNSDGSGWNYYYQYCANGCTNGVCGGQTCQAQSTGSTFCSGDFVARNYQYTDCSTGAQIQQFCPNGCLQGNCLPVTSKASVQVDSSYTLSACDVTPVDFKVINTGDKQTDFSISVSGDAAAWIHTPSTVTLDSKEEKFVTALVSVPCDAKGSKTFSITVKGGTNNTQNSLITVGQAKATVPTPSLRSFASLLALVIVIVAGVVAYRSGWFQRYVQNFRKREEPF